MTRERASQLPAIPDVFYELADELAERQHELRKVSAPRPAHPHPVPHDVGPVPPPPGAPAPPAPGAPLPPPPGTPAPPPRGPVPPPPGEPLPFAGPGPVGAPRPIESWGPEAEGPGPKGPRQPAPIDRIERGTMAALRYLAKNGGEATPSTIAVDLHLSNARISNILAALEKRGWVTREHDDVDRRKVLVKLTEDGAAYIDGLSRQVRGDLASFLAELGEEDSRQLIAILGRVIKVAQERRDRAIDEEVQGLMDAGEDVALGPGAEPSLPEGSHPKPPAPEDALPESPRPDEPLAPEPPACELPDSE